MSEEQTVIYLDHAATTPLHPAAREAMAPWLSGEKFGNPASEHLTGFAAARAVETARGQVAELIGTSAGEIVWTSGATEANNLALKGVLGFRSGVSGRLVTPRTEHKSVVDTARWLERQGHVVTWLGVDEYGRVDPDEIDALLSDTRRPVSLLSLMWVNNETGVIQDIPRIAKIAHSRGVRMHVDATQAAGRLPINLLELPVDLLSLSAHKLGGPQGIGALFVRGNPRARLVAQMHGGGHERGLRSGTLPVHQCVGFGAACETVSTGREAEQARQQTLCERLRKGLGSLPEVHLNGHPRERVAGILNLSFGYVDGDALLAALTLSGPALAVSSGSACTSATREPSYVLRALGRDDALARASLRFSLGHTTTDRDIDIAIERVTAELNRLRGMSPHWQDECKTMLSAPGGLPPGSRYGNAVWRRFLSPGHAGIPAEQGVITVQAGTPADDSVIRIGLVVDGDEISRAGFLVHGCPEVVATADFLCERIAGTAVEKLDSKLVADLETGLLLPPEKRYCRLLAEDLLQALTEAIQKPVMQAVSN